MLTTRAPFSVYCDWGFHDELGDSVELTAEMAHAALDALERWKRDFGIAFDYYLIDCFWFDPDKGYRHFKRSHWPDGFGPVRERIEALGMKPGLWYSTNGGQLRVPAWEASKADNNWHYSLAEGPFADDFERSLLHAAGEWGVRFFKFDFAGLHMAAAGTDRPAEETYRLSLRRLKAILRRVRQRFPDIRAISHCGFWRVRAANLTGERPGPVYDASLLEAMDLVFSGDPHPCDVPRTDLTRCCDLYQDAMVHRVHREGFPLHRIEDHGAMAGDTNTCHYRGRRGLRRSHLGQLARGGRRDMFYGDPTLATDEDLAGMAATRRVFFDAFNRELMTAPVGGEPGVAPWHGFLAGGGDRGLLYIVNGTMEARRAELAVPGCCDARVLFRDGPAPGVQAQPDRLGVELGPEQIALIGLGDYADPAWDVGEDRDPPRPSETRLLPATFRQASDRAFVAELDSPPPAGWELVVTAEALDAAPNGPITALPYRFARQTTRETPDRTPEAHRALKITAEDARGQPIAPVAEVPAVPIWSGISWTLRRFAPSSPCRIRIEQTFDDPRRLRLTARAARFGGPTR